MAEPDATGKLDGTDGTEATATELAPAGGAVGAERFVPFVQAGALIFLGLLAFAALSLVVLKLQFPELGSGADPIEMLTGLVILALAVLRVPVHIGELTITILPLGAMAIVAWIVRWSCRTVVIGARPRYAAVVGLTFGSMAAIAALVFRYRFETDPIHAGAFGAFVLGTLWISLWAALSFATIGRDGTGLLRTRIASLRSRRRQLFDGLRTGTVMVGTASLLAAAAGMFGTIVVLLRGGGPAYDHVGQLVAALFYVLVFAPNLVVAIVSLSLGAPLELGAGLTIGGRVRETVRQISIFEEGLDPILLLLLVPLVSCGIAGYWARSYTPDPASARRVLAIGAFVFAFTFAVLAAIGDVRLGARLTADRGFGVVAPSWSLVFVLGLVWAAGAGYAGWVLAGRRA